MKAALKSVPVSELVIGDITLTSCGHEQVIVKIESSDDGLFNIYYDNGSCSIKRPSKKLLCVVRSK
jgi:hypothetical protein